MDITSLREEYARSTLNETDAAADPFAQFSKWFDEALKSKVPVPNAMTLATVADNGGPTARIVLLKEFDPQGFVFFTNYESRKGRDLTRNPRASLLFFWAELERQVRIEGTVSKVNSAESDAYYPTRPIGARLGAWASPQSEVLPDRAVLEQRLAEMTRRYGDNPPRPPHWGGYRLVPDSLEFWQGRTSRLHDRLRYRRNAQGMPGSLGWIRERLAP